MNVKSHHADIAIIGGGLAGMCAAIAAARHAKQVVLIHDRPVYGGNCSSEIRMWPLGAHGDNSREAGIFEEIVLENMRINPWRTYPMWDAVLYSAIRKEKNITAIMNCSVNAADVKDGHIYSVSGWQLTSYTTHTVTADIFIDCSGDSILAQLAGAVCRKGRESRHEFGEEAAPETADSCTMGNSLMIQAQQYGQPISYTPPAWARHLSEDQLTDRCHDFTSARNNFWWMEMGGERDTLAECEEIKDDLLALAYGAWDHVKNGGDHDADCWDLAFAGWLPGKRESLRCVGDHILTQPEVTAGTPFEDIVAYGGWAIDNHPPKGFEHDGEPTQYFPSAKPFGIPYRCLYSVNIDNLMFAGRNISATHCAMAAARVMATCAILGQAVGTAAALACRYHTDPRGVNAHMKELQQQLMQDDCWLPGHRRAIDPICRNARLSAAVDDAEILRSGIERPMDNGSDNGCHLPLGAECTYTLDAPAYVRQVRLVFDSDFGRKTVEGGMPEVEGHPTLCNRIKDMKPFTFPKTMTDSFRILADGKVIHEVTGNRQRLVCLPIERTVSTLTFVPLTTCGAESAHVFSFDFCGKEDFL